MNTKVYIAMMILVAGHMVTSSQQPTNDPATMKYVGWLYSEVGRVSVEAQQWKDMAEDMVREVECIPLVGGKENRRFNRHDDPSTTVNDPERYWYL